MVSGYVLLVVGLAGAVYLIWGLWESLKSGRIRLYRQSPCVRADNPILYWAHIFAAVVFLVVLAQVALFGLVVALQV